MNKAHEPFRFLTASYLTRISAQKATNLRGLEEALETCSDHSIFYHTFQTLGRHHFLTEGFSNDFAQWVLAATNQAALAERLAGIDIRDYLSLADLRNAVRRVVKNYCEAFPAECARTAFEPFYFCESIQVTVPLNREARTLEEFERELRTLSHDTLHFHFIASRLRLHLRTNDFSHWFATALGMERLAARIDAIDIYTNTLDSVQASLLALVEGVLKS